MGTKRDYNQAIQLYHAAAFQHHTTAMFQIAEMYMSGRGTPRSCSQALPYYKAVAEKGEPSESMQVDR